MSNAVTTTAQVALNPGPAAVSEVQVIDYRRSEHGREALVEPVSPVLSDRSPRTQWVDAADITVQVAPAQ